ncbi:hypothetical protein GCM10007876_40380 [Litoribrevibacter albus]|uniref:Uncharacterized protein n=1 Tax=Litoribrevibacter albus TaxID=1473156 RepID=A0AA37SF28_9GAMM|nr:hypothetical protein GCM10007876_40380 [Litoribrevibacter albus]
MFITESADFCDWDNDVSALDVFSVGGAWLFPVVWDSVTEGMSVDIELISI